jgi:hypothetical protein
MKGVQGFSSGLSERMSADMKRTNREGAESFRLIDEAIGIHMSRPLTRLITSEFPALAKGLQSILGIGAVGALATVGFEFGERIAASIEKAKKAQQDYDESIHHTEDVLADLGASHARTMQEIELRMAALRGKPGANALEALFKIDTAALAEAKKGIDEIAEAMEREAKSAAKIAGVLQQIKLAAGFTWDNFWSDASAQADATSGKFLEFKRTLDLIMEARSADPMQGMRESLRRLDDELSNTGAEIARKLAAIQLAQATTILAPGPHGSQHAMHPDSGVNQDVLAGQEKYFEMLQEQQKRLQQVLDETSGHHQVANQDDALKNAAKSVEKAKQATREYQQEVKGWNDEHNEWIKQFERTNEALEKSLEKLSSEAFKTSPRPQFSDFTPHVAPPGGAPMLPDQAELAKITNDQNESWRKAGEILAQIETPAQKYATGLATLKVMQSQGRLTTEQMALATQVLNEQLLKAADRVHQLQEEMMKLLERSTSAKDGLKAFWKQLEINAAENGKFSFGLANEAFKDFEDGIARTILATANQHHQLKVMWENYFKQLEEMALKYAITKSLVSIANLIPHTATVGDGIGLQNPGAEGGSTAKTFAAQQTKAPWWGMLTKLLIGAGATALTGPAAISAVGTSLFKQLGGGAGNGGQGIPLSTSAFPDQIALDQMPLFAGGGDAIPGSSFISGEAGAERVDLTRAGGAHITPLASKGAGDTHTHYYDFRGAVVTDDLLRKGDAAAMMSVSEKRGAALSAHMQSEIARRSRPTR